MTGERNSISFQVLLNKERKGWVGAVFK